MAKKRRKTTPKTESVGSTYLPQSAQTLGTFTPGVLNMPRAGVYVPNQELKQVMGLLSGFGEAYSSITKSIRGDGSSNLGNLRRDGAEDMNWYRAEFESGRAAIAPDGGGLSLQDEYFQLVELHGNPSEAAYSMATGIAAQTLGAEISDKGHILPNDNITQPEIDAYLQTMLDGTAAVLRSHYSGFAEERKVLYNDGIISDLVFAADNELKSNSKLWKEVQTDHENWLMDPGSREIYMLGLNVTAIQQATEAGLYERAEKLMTRLPEGYGARKGLDAKLVLGRRETAMTSLGAELAGLTGSNYATWSMSDELVEDLASAVTHIKDGDTASRRMIDTIDSVLKENHIPIGKKETFIRKFRNASDKDGNLLFPQGSNARNRIKDLLDSLPDEYEQMRQQQARDAVERTEARQLSLAYLLDKQIVVKDADGNDKTITKADDLSTYLRDTYNLGNDFALEMMELDKKITGLQGDSAGNEVTYADFMTQIKISNVAERREVGDKIIKSLGDGNLTVAQANTLWNMNSLETSYEDDKFSPEAIGLFDQVYNAFWRAAGAAALTPPTASGQRLLWALPKDADRAADGDWMALEAQLRGDWRAWITHSDNKLLKETDPNAYLTARTAEIIRLSGLYLATGDTSKITDYDIKTDLSAHRRGGRWSPKESK